VLPAVANSASGQIRRRGFTKLRRNLNSYPGGQESWQWPKNRTAAPNWR
jgi:hypothetical protein